ncbi:uncharacterized protein isoform X1 [Danio rerio]|uniref:Uncharacterized protein isoform X1 n=1 Tax=Danio rerio TaxID=7955 RepID=A0AC58G9E2_DANRE
MSAARALHLLIFGFTMLRFIGCYSDGSLLTDQCQSMAIDHGVQPPGQDSIIFSVDPDNVIVDSSQVGTGITVTLSSSGSFMGFMLEARECDDCPPAGTFSLLDPVNSLLLCGDQAVAQPNNDDKTSVLVTWTPQATGQFYFRAAFVQSYNFGSPKKAIILPTTTTLPLVGMTMATSPPATTPTMTQTMMKTDYAFSSTVTKTITQTTTTQTMTQTTTSTDTTATVTTSRTTIDTSTAPPTSAVGSTQTGLTVFTTPNLQATVNTTQTDPTTTVISSTQSQTTVNTTQTDPTTNTTVITTSNTQSQNAVNTTQTDPTTNTTLTSNTQSQTTVSAVNTTKTDPTTNTTLTSNTRSQTTVSAVNTTQTDLTKNTTLTSNTRSQTTVSAVNTTQTDPTTNTTLTSNTQSQTTVNTTQTDPTTNTTVITTSDIQSQTTVNTTQTDPTTNTTVITTSNTRSQTTVNTTQTKPTTNEKTTSNTQTAVNTTQTDPTTNTTVITTLNTRSQTTVTPSYRLQCVQYMRSGVALLLFSRLCFLGGSSLLMIIKPVSKMPTQIASIIELISKIITTVLVLIKVVHYDCENAGLQFVFAALIVIAMITSLMHTITVFLHRGLSHELKTCWIGSLIIVDLLNTLITSMSIFYGLWWFQGRWMLIVMTVYVTLEFILYLGAAVFKRMEKYKKYFIKRNTKRVEQNCTVLENKKPPWFLMFVICLVFYVMFTVALIVGVSLLCFQAGSSCMLLN